ncbi:hypothetical protein ACFE04_027508 [Oxalis oulophora]
MSNEVNMSLTSSDSNNTTDSSSTKSSTEDIEDAIIVLTLARIVDNYNFRQNRIPCMNSILRASSSLSHSRFLAATHIPAAPSPLSHHRTTIDQFSPDALSPSSRRHVPLQPPKLRSITTTIVVPLTPLPAVHLSLFKFLAATPLYSPAVAVHLADTTDNYDLLYIVHLDLEASVEERMDLKQFVAANQLFNKIRMIVKANLVTYRGPTMVANTLHVAAILLREGGEWDWFINLSATDYPLLTQDDLLHMFSYLTRDLNFIDHTSNIGWKEYQRAKPIIIGPGLYMDKKADVFWVTQRRSVPTAFKLYTGTSFLLFSLLFLVERTLCSNV